MNKTAMKLICLLLSVLMLATVFAGCNDIGEEFDKELKAKKESKKK